MNIIQQLNWRYATKFFDKNKKISENDWNIIEESLILSASSFGLQPWKFVVVKDQATREILKQNSWNQPQVTDASHYVVLCGKTDMTKEYIENFIQHVAKTRNIPVDSLEQYKNMMIGFSSQMSNEAIASWNANQTYIALGSVLVAAATMNIDTCALEGIDRTKYNEILNLKGYQALCACAFGYRSSEDKNANLTKVRFDKEAVIEYI